jgi:sphinganine C4-monooxygenase
MSNATLAATLPPLPTYDLTPRPPLLPVLSDKLLVVLLPIAAYWVMSLFFHYLDVNDYLPQYRLHTPSELLKRNRVSRYEVVRDVLLQQFIQALTGTLIAMTEPDDMVGSEKYDITVLARRIRLAQSAVPKILSLLGINGSLLAQKLSAYPQIAGVVLGGQYPAARQMLLGPTGEAVWAPAFATWELCLAQIFYWLLIPGLQFSFAIFFLDTWQYFLHRGMHMNQWLYRKLFTDFPHQAYGPAWPGTSPAVGLC